MKYKRLFNIMLINLVILIGLVLIIWSAGLLFTTDFSVKTLDIKKYKRVLIIFPHPDDEILTAAGTIGKLHNNGTHITLALLTKGEKGNPQGTPDNNLKSIREKEAQEAAKLLNINELIHEDFGDGELINKTPQITEYIKELITKNNPDLVITYDQSGLYGHPDHIAVSQVVTAIITKEKPDCELWYATYPKRVLEMIKLPVHMAKDSQFLNNRKTPTGKIFIGASLINKINGLYLYKSQYQSYADSMPIKQIPLWFWYSLTVYEYFYQVPR